MEVNQSMYKFHSCPAVNQRGFVRPKIYNSDAQIFLLSNSLMEKILINLPFRELSSLRGVCHWFYYVIGTMSNRKFLSLNPSIDKEIGYLKKTRDDDGLIRILRIVRCEVKMLEANCLDYILTNMYFFHGGKIIDCVDHIMKTKDRKGSYKSVSELFILVDNFLDNFDVVIEPEIIKRSIHLPFSWFGKKIIDMLDCYMNFDYQIVLNPQLGQTHCTISGTYRATGISSIFPPPVLFNSLGNSRDMLVILKYLRNHIRWNNVLNYINYHHNVEQWTQNSDSKIIYNRRVQKSQDTSNGQSLILSLELLCHKVLAPLKCRDHLGSLYVTKKMGGGEPIHYDTVPLKPSDYELSMSVEVVYNFDGIYKIMTAQICHIDDNCYIATNTDDFI